MKEVIKKIKKSRIFSLICILLFICVCMGIGSGIAYVQHESDPTDVAVTYFRAFVQKNYEKMYECLYQDEGYYIDKEMYINKIKKLRETYVIDSYDIGEPTIKDGKDAIIVECKNESEKKSQNFVIYIESERKGMNIIPDYYIDAGSMLVKDVKITIPKDDALKINGKIFDKEAYRITESNNNNVYHFEKMLIGKYAISATNDIYARNKTLNIDGEHTNIDLTKEKITANDKYQKIITENGKKLINQFYKSVRNRDKDNKTLMKMFGTKKLKSKASELVEESEDIIFWPEKRNVEKFKVLDMNIKNLKTSISYSKKDKNYILACTYQYKYVSSTDTSLANSYVDRISGTCSSKLTLIYKADGDSVAIEGIKLTNKNKKN